MVGEVDTADRVLSAVGRAPEEVDQCTPLEQEEHTSIALLKELHSLLGKEPEVDDVMAILEKGGEQLKDIIDTFPDADNLDGERRNLLHVTLREVNNDFLAEELCLIFLRAGASGINCGRDVTQRSAHDYALSRGLSRLWSIFQKEPQDVDYDIAFSDLRKEKVLYYSDLLRNSVIENKIEDIDDYLDQGADPNLPNKNGFSSLHFAVVKTKPENKFDVLKKLVDRGADVNYRDTEGNTALSLFLKRIEDGDNKNGTSQSDDETIRYLVLAGTDVSLKDSKPDIKKDKKTKKRNLDNSLKKIKLVKKATSKKENNSSAIESNDLLNESSEESIDDYNDDQVDGDSVKVVNEDVIDGKVEPPSESKENVTEKSEKQESSCCIIL